MSSIGWQNNRKNIRIQDSSLYHDQFHNMKTGFHALTMDEGKKRKKNKRHNNFPPRPTLEVVGRSHELSSMTTVPYRNRTGADNCTQIVSYFQNTTTNHQAHYDLLSPTVTPPCSSTSAFDCHASTATHPEPLTPPAQQPELDATPPSALNPLSSQPREHHSSSHRQICHCTTLALREQWRISSKRFLNSVER
ncbi:hypothetical protein RYX36_016704 [Vicia faba]